jgi:hypothetical protein
MLEMLLAVMAACPPGRKATEGLPKDVKAQIGKTRELTPCSLSSLPEQVRQKLVQTVSKVGPPIADLGEEWNSSDKGIHGVPRTGFERGAHSDRVWVVDYWAGGIVVRYRVIVIGLENDQATVLWHGECQGGPSGKGKGRCEERK